MNIREKLNQHPAIGRTIAIVAVLLAVYLAFRSGRNTAPDSLERRSETVTIRDTETGDEWTMNRGQFERLLLLQNGLIDENGGIPSQFSEGRPTGVLVNKTEWQETVQRINDMKRQMGAGG
jgi:hypothetical protein|tara:strand:+ start:20680 stop:21042 length:363 start_codon:yes stop_codon:yes gene_type:complete